jgi:hypothetical protein
MAVDLERECFFIAPIGDQGTDIRKRSDGVRDWIVKPAAAAHNLETRRADDVGEPGQITAQAVQHCLKAKAAVADLTGGNPNVYYELSVRHGAQLPVVLIAEEGTKLPFDISQSRVIFFDHTDLTSAGSAREMLQEQIEASLTGAPDNPISDGMRLAELTGGNPEEQTLASIVEQLGRVATTVERLDQRTATSSSTTSGGEWARRFREKLADMTELEMRDQLGELERKGMLTKREYDELTTLRRRLQASAAPDDPA